jgi:hypothetical protein
MTNKKETALDWVIGNLETQINMSIQIDGQTQRAEDHRRGLLQAISFCKHGKLIEEEQIEDAYKQGVVDEYGDALDKESIDCDYYMKTFATDSINKNNAIAVAERLYYEENPETKMDVPSFVYAKVERLSGEWRKSRRNISLYQFCKEVMGKQKMFAFARSYADYIWERSDSTDETREDILKPYTPEEFYNKIFLKKF